MRVGTQTLATKPLTAVAGAYPLSDLLFSPRAAFIWNHTRQSVVWINPAARAAFALRLEDFSASIPASLIRRFAQFAERNESGAATLKIPGVQSLSCSVEILKLADGQDGLIVTESDGATARPPAPPPAPEKPKKQKRIVRKAPASSAGPRRKAPETPPTLNADEMRAFKAVGRKVLRLCEEKKQLPPRAAAPEPAASPASVRETSGLATSRAQALKDVLGAFDLVLFLSDDLDIVGFRGRPARLGLRRGKLTGTAAAYLLVPQDRTILRRMLRKLEGPTACVSRDALFVRSESGNAIPCRTVLGRLGEQDAAFFLAFISLKLPVKLERSQPANAMAAARLAA